MRLKEQQDLREQLDRFFRFTGVSVAFEDGQTAKSVLEKLAEHFSVRLRRR